MGGLVWWVEVGWGVGVILGLVWWVEVGGSGVFGLWWCALMMGMRWRVFDVWLWGVEGLGVSCGGMVCGGSGAGRGFFKNGPGRGGWYAGLRPLSRKAARTHSSLDISVSG